MDEENIKRVVLEAEALNADNFDLNKICQGVVSNQMYNTYPNIVMKTIRL